LTHWDTQKLYGAVKSDRKRPLQEVTNIFNEYRARPVSDRIVQRKLYETKYHKCVSEEKNLKKLTSQKQELPVVAMFVNGLGLNEQSS